MSASVRPVRASNASAAARVTYRWDDVTGILAARIERPPHVPSETNQFALAGRDGAWITLELAGDRLAGIDVVIWPTVRHVPGLVAPTVTPGTLSWRRLAMAPQVRALSAALVADASFPNGLVRLRIAGRQATRVVREADEVLIELDAAGAFAGIWLLNVPPCPEGV